jgi:hypothetical protein
MRPNVPELPSGACGTISLIGRDGSDFGPRGGVPGNRHAPAYDPDAGFDLALRGDSHIRAIG